MSINLYSKGKVDDLLDGKASVAGSVALSVTGSGGTSTLGADSGATISADDGAGSVTKLTTTGITFPDSTTQTTAAVAGAKYADVISMGCVQDVTWTGSAWQVTFSPINPYIGNLGFSVTNGSTTETATGSWSSSSTWTYTTTGFGSTDYVYIYAFSEQASYPCNNP